MKCPKCGTSVQDDSDYCRKCGTKIIRKDDDVFVYLCPICKTPNPKYATHCVKCGHWMLDTNFKSIPLNEKEYYESIGNKNYTIKKEETKNPTIAKVLYIIFFVFFILASVDVKFGLCVFIGIFGIINIIVPLRKLLINKRSTGFKILAIGVILTVFCANYFDITPSTTTNTPKVSMSEYKSQCQSITYDELAHKTEKYINTKVKLNGKVIQVQENGSNIYLRVNITKGKFNIYQDTIWVNYTLKSGQNHIIENDIIDIWGNVKGRKKYMTVMKSNVTLPEVDAAYIELLS